MLINIEQFTEIGDLKLFNTGVQYLRTLFYCLFLCSFQTDKMFLEIESDKIGIIVEIKTHALQFIFAVQVFPHFHVFPFILLILTNSMLYGSVFFKSISTYCSFNSFNSSKRQHDEQF